MTAPIRSAIRPVLRGITFVSGVCALSLLLLPLMLASLMLLFDNTAQGVMVLLGSITAWFRSALPGAANLPAYRSLSLDPAAIAWSAFIRMAPCLAGLVATLVWPRQRIAWGIAALLWLSAIVVGGRLVSIMLSPGLVAALLLCGGVGAIDDGDRRAA